MRCNLCDKEISSKNLLQHCQSNHNIERPNLRQHATIVTPKPDSIYQNLEKLKPGIVMATEEGEQARLSWATLEFQVKVRSKYGCGCANVRL